VLEKYEVVEEVLLGSRVEAKFPLKLSRLGNRASPFQTRSPTTHFQISEELQFPIFSNNDNRPPLDQSSSKWVAFIPTVKVYQPPPSHTPELLLRG
jgi:hypothetical protein